MSTDELSFDQRGLPSCHLFVFTTFPSRSMASAPVLTRARRHPSGMPAAGWCDGSWTPVHFTPCRASQAGAPASTTPSPATGGRASAWRSWGATSSARSADRGPTRRGRAGGEEPPFHTPVFVLPPHVRPSIEMKGGTTFHFIDASPAQALAAAKEAAGGLDVRIGGGVAAVRQFLAAGLIDHMHIALVPILLGRGESLWDGLEGLEERFAVESVSSPSGVTHVTFTRR